MIRIGDTPFTLFIGAASVEGLYIGPVKVYPDREPVITVEYGAWVTQSLSLSASQTEIPAAGGSATVSAVAHQVRTKTTLADGVPVATEQETQSIAVTPSLSSNNAAWTVSGTTVSCGSRGTVAGGQLSATITGTYDRAAGATTLYQQANQPISYEYRVVTVSSGSTIAWGGGDTTVGAKSQRTTTYTSGATSGYEDTVGQTLSVRVVGSGFTVSYQTNTGFTYYFTVTAGANSSTSQRTGTVIFTGSAGGSDSATVRQAAMPVFASWRNSSTSAASQYPEFFVNGNTTTYPTTRNYTGAVAYTVGNNTTYHNADLQADTLYGIEQWFGLGSRWGSQGSTFMGFTNPGGFMNGYGYSYTTIPFTTSTPAGTTLNGVVLVQKSDGDYEAAGYPSWPSTSPYAAMFSEAEQTAMALLAENGAVTDADDPVLRDVDFVALCEKINNLRMPDTNTYILNEDGTWAVVESKS